MEERKESEEKEETVAREEEQINDDLDVVRSVSFDGPLPPPELLKGYEDAYPGSSDRILKMTEKEQSHRHAQESMLVNRQTIAEMIGMFLTAGICFVGLYLGYLLINQGKITEGLASAILVNLIPLAIRYIEYRENKRQEDNELSSKDS